MPASGTTRISSISVCCGPTEMRPGFYRCVCQLARVAAVLIACTGSVRAGTLEVTVRDDAGKPVPGAVVFVDAPGGPVAESSQQDTAVMDQAGKKFVPQILVVPVGAKVSFPNSDNIRHHVYSFSEARNFELPLYAGTPADPISFPVAGVVVLGCNIHDWMRGYIVVVPQPFFAQTNPQGVATLSGVPPGRWRVQGWHPDLAEQRPVVGEEIDSAASTSAELRLNLKRKLQLRRAPGGRGAERY